MTPKLGVAKIKFLFSHFTFLRQCTPYEINFARLKSLDLREFKKMGLSPLCPQMSHLI